MPSGAKRRKAAKKKQEKIAHITENQPVNGDSSRSQDEKDSDSSSVSSPTTSQHSRNPLTKNDNNNNNNTDDDKSDTAGSASDDPRDVSKSKERSQFDEVEVTKEVDFESRVVKIDDAKEEESESSNGGIQVVEKKIDIVPTQIEEEKELIESKEVEKVEKDIPVSVIEPIKEAVEEASQPEGVIEAVEINIVEKTGGSGVIDAQSGDRELPESNGTSVDTVNGSGDTVQSCISTNLDNEKKDIVPVLPPTVRPTSWKSCCGLFDVFGGSNR